MENKQTPMQDLLQNLKAGQLTERENLLDYVKHSIKEERKYIQNLKDQIPEWISVEERLPNHNDTDYLVAVKNKNKEGGIFLFDVANFSSDGIWIKSNTWEKVTHWQPKPKDPTDPF